MKTRKVLSCDPTASKNQRSGPKTWEASARAIESFCLRLERAGYVPVLFVAPRVAEEHAPLLDELAGRKIEMDGLNNGYSVIQRINSGRFDLEYDVGPSYVRFLGALRPMIGAVFGLALYFAVTSRILKLFELPQDRTDKLYALLVIAFLAGFSERWAQDTLTSLSGGGGSRQTKPAPEPEGKEPEGKS